MAVLGAKVIATRTTAVIASGMSGWALAGAVGGVILAACAIGTLMLSIAQNQRSKRREIDAERRAREEERRQHEHEIDEAYKRGRQDERQYQADLRSMTRRRRTSGDD